MLFRKVVFSTILLFSFIKLYSQILEPDAVIKKMENNFSNMKGFSARFIERNDKKIYRGNIIYKAPGKFRLTYREPKSEVVVDEENQAVVCNGETLWIYMPRIRTLSEQKLDTNSNTGGFYTKKGVSRLAKEYNFNFYNNIRDLKPLNTFKSSDLGVSGYKSEYADNDTREAYHMELTPKETSTEKAGFTKIHLWIDKNGMIIRVIGLSNTKAVVEYIFADINYNDIYNDDAFNIVVPQGILVLKNALVPK